MKEPKENSKIKLSFIDIEKMLGEAGFREHNKRSVFDALGLKWLLDRPIEKAVGNL